MCIRRSGSWAPRSFRGGAAAGQTSWYRPARLPSLIERRQLGCTTENPDEHGGHLDHAHKQNKRRVARSRRQSVLFVVRNRGGRRFEPSRAYQLIHLQITERAGAKLTKQFHHVNVFVKILTCKLRLSRLVRKNCAAECRHFRFADYDSGSSEVVYRTARNRGGTYQ